MAAEIKSYDEVRGYGENLVTQAEAMLSNFEVIQNQVDRIDSGEGVFDGVAAADIKAQVNAFTSQLHLFSDAVKSCGEFVQQVVTTYESADKAARNAVSGGGNGDSSHTGASSARL